MTLTVEVLYWGGTLNISSGSVTLEDLGDLGAASIRRLSERGPQQDGDTDLGYRADPMVLTLPHILQGTSDAHLDSMRDSLNNVYAPTTDPLNLRVTRDDGSVRQLDVHRTGPLAMPVRRMQRPGHFGRAVVQVKASNPVWYDPTPGTTPFLSPSDWWLAYNTIGSANALEYVESPAQAAVWTYRGTVAAGSPWFVAIRSGKETISGDKYAFIDNASNFFAVTGGNYSFTEGGFGFMDGTAIMSAGTHNYFFISGTANRYIYRDGTQIATTTLGAGQTFVAEDAFGTARWRSFIDGTAAPSFYWTEALPRAAFYNIHPSAAQIAALNSAMESGGSVYNVSLAYAGSWPEYPVITITGPISDPILTNTSTGEVLDFTGYTIGSTDYYTIDLRYGHKTVTNGGGDNKFGQLSSSSDWATFHIAPASEVSGGTNVFSLSGTAAGTATAAQIVYYPRYVSY